MPSSVKKFKPFAYKNISQSPFFCFQEQIHYSFSH